MDNPRHLTDTHAAPPASAFQFLAEASLAPASAEPNAPRQLSGVAYSGGVIEPHAYWGRVVFDLDTTEIPERVPVLVDHDRSRRVGVARLAVQNGAVVIAEGQLLGNEEAREVAEDADAGFPWQLSVHIDPARVQQVEPNESVMVNGAELSGPLFVFRQSRIREVSLTPTGADHRTSAQIFSASTPGAPNMQQQNETVEALRAQIAERDARIAALSDQVAQFSAKQREADVRGLFADLGRQFSAEAAAPYLALDATAFAAVAADLRANRPAPAAPAAPAGNAPAHLFSEQATGGSSGETLTATQLAERARQFQAEAERQGRTVSTAEAVRAVRAQASGEPAAQ